MNRLSTSAEVLRVCQIAGATVALAALLGCESSSFGIGPPAGSVVNVEDLGPLETNPMIQGRDGGYSALVMGESVWLYGDTILAQPDEQGETWHNSSMSWTSDLDPRDGVTGFMESLDSVGAPEAFVPLNVEEITYNLDHALTDQAKWALWPAGLVANRSLGQTLVFYFKVHTLPGPFNFEVVGSSLALWQGPGFPLERQTVQPGSQEPTLLFNRGEPMLAEGAVVHNARLYAYDCDGLFDKECVIGRVQLQDVLRRDAWKFWDGGAWGSSSRNAEPVLTGSDIMSVHFSRYLGRFIAFYSQPLSNEVRYRTAPAPEGPWSEPRLAFDSLPPTEGTFNYSAVAHAELAHDNVEYVSYHRGLAPFESEIRLVRVELRR